MKINSLEVSGTKGPSPHSIHKKIFSLEVPTTVYSHTNLSGRVKPTMSQPISRRNDGLLKGKRERVETYISKKAPSSPDVSINESE